MMTPFPIAGQFSGETAPQTASCTAVTTTRPQGGRHENSTQQRWPLAFAHLNHPPRLSESSFGSVTRNANGTYTARVSVDCANGKTSKSATGNTPLVQIPPPNNLGCNAGTSARAQRVVGTGAIVENATAVGGDDASAGNFSLHVVGVLPYATASFTMAETDMSSTLAQYLITWKGDLGTAGQVQWFDLSNSNQLDIINLAGGTSQPHRLISPTRTESAASASMPKLTRPASWGLFRNRQVCFCWDRARSVSAAFCASDGWHEVRNGVFWPSK